MLPAPSDLDRWRQQLYVVSGSPNEHLSWLEPVWHGEPEVCRVVLYQVIPSWATSPLFWAEGQHDRVTRINGRLAPDPRYRVALEPQLLTWRQWELYERFGCMAQPYWIVQGTRGGHKRQFNATEERLLSATGQPTTPAAAGDLPFAPVDERVFRALARMDEMAMWTKAKALYDRDPADFAADERDALRRGQQKLTAWLTDQVAEVFDETLTYRKTARDVFEAVGSDAPLPDLDAQLAALDAA